MIKANTIKPIDLDNCEEIIVCSDSEKDTIDLIQGEDEQYIKIEKRNIPELIKQLNAHNVKD